MKRKILSLSVALFATGSLLAAPTDDVQTAIKKLTDSGSFSWSSTTTNLGGGGGGGGGGRGGRGGGPAAGKLGKDGFALVTRAGFQGGTMETFMKGDKSVSKNQDGEWQTPEERMAAFGGGGGGAPGGGRGGFMRNLNRLPTAEATELLTGVKELKLADGVYSGDLTTEAATARLNPFGGRGGPPGGEAPPAPTGVKGSVKFWVQDGLLAKYEINVQGKTTNFQGDSMDVNRTTTVAITDVGTTKVEVPEEAKKKLM